MVQDNNNDAVDIIGFSTVANKQIRSVATEKLSLIFIICIVWSHEMIGLSFGWTV